MAKTSTTIDLRSMKKAYDDSSKVATNYIDFDATNGLRISQSGDYTKPYVQIINNGINIIRDSTHKVVIDSDSMDIYVGNASNSIATFGDPTTIGALNKQHIELSSNSFEMKDSSGTSFFKIRDAINESGQVVDIFAGDGLTTTFTLNFSANSTSYTVTQNGTTVTPTKTTTNITFSTAPAVGDEIIVTYNVSNNAAKGYDIGVRKSGTVTGQYSVVEGYATTASGKRSHAEGGDTIASGSYAHAEGYDTTAAGGGSHAEGRETIANGAYAHAEGQATTASGNNSHAEGSNTTASGGYAHAEGTHTIASGTAAHAMGRHTEARGSCSFTGGEYTTASGANQMVLGRYNEAEVDKSFIIGNGKSSTPLNIFTIDWDGNVDIKGDYQVNGSPITGAITACGDSSGEQALTTSEATLPLTTYRVKQGDNFTVINNGVRCEKTGTVMIAAQAYFTTGFTQFDITHLIITVNDSGTTTNAINNPMRIPSTYHVQTIPPQIWNVTAGSMIYLRVYNQTAARGMVSKGVSTTLTVKYI